MEGQFYESTHGRTMYFGSAGCLAAQPVRAKSAFPTDRSRGASSGNPGYSANFPDIGDQAAVRSAGCKSLYGSNCPNGDSYVLKAGNQQYLLDSQKKARKYEGKDVKITGRLDKAKNLIHVEKIDASPSM